MRQDYSEFAARNAEILSIGPDSQTDFREFWENKKMPFVGLADPHHVVADLYGQEVSLLRLGRMPALFVIDSAGQVRYRHFASSMSDIPENTGLLKVLDQLNEESGR